jgi:predicted transcriptional regulator
MANLNSLNPMITDLSKQDYPRETKKTKMRATSIISFYQNLETIGDKQLECLQAIRKLQPCSDRQIKDYLHWEINQVNGRRNELFQMGIIRKEKEDISEKTKRKVTFWKIKSYMNDVLQC